MSKSGSEIMNIAMHVTTGPTSRRSPLALGLLLCGVLCATTCEAEEPDRSLLEDTKLYVTAPLRWDSQGWMNFARYCIRHWHSA